MRRPSPLPPPAGASAPRGRDEPRRPRERPRDAGVVPNPAAADAGAAAETLDPDVQQTAPIAPLFPEAGRPDAVRLEKEPLANEEPDAGARPVGMRDVWRAARARRRALRAEVRRFTVRQRRRRFLWLGIAASLVLLTVVTVGAAYSPLFAVRQVQVVGTQRLPAEDVADALSAQIGTPLAAIDESAVKAALVQFPLVESYTLEARPPHDLVVRIVERTPIGVLSSAAGYTLVDAAGVALSTTPDAPEGYPLLDVAAGADSTAFAAVGRVMRALPADLRSQVTGVAASTPDDVTLTLGAANAQVVWGSADRSAQKALVLERGMAAIPPDGVSVYDVSSPEALVVR
ncbi:FtsQ-type POTRA domain-containing protein [Microbacterium sp. 18062]|uniref:FtsQ-type POTRA domain-containing protein n=1 Tax=Microbacterium sp. 18062 TaxID=2681410 RepID=UPI00135C301C|nr:FtsQ-type POTRA domain-containing protein [Microbacterium sp. 18062]